MCKIFLVCIFLASIFLVSCSHIRSGMHVAIRENDSIESLAKEFNVSVNAIINANQDKKLIVGNWIFIPQNIKNSTQGLERPTKDIQNIEIDDSFYQKIYDDTGDFTWPVPSHKKISSHFGPRWGRHHDGIDIPARHGSHIIAVSDGIVVYAGAGIGGYGNLTIISHKNGLFSVYAHSDKLFTVKGRRVYKGQVIATVGNTGRVTGTHLHFEIRKNSNPIDPKKIFARVNK